MADEPQSVANGNRRETFGKDLSRAAAKKILAPLASAAATAGTAYLMRKGTQILQEKVLPKMRDKGGATAAAKEALEQVAGRVGGRGSDVLLGLARRLDATQHPASHASAQEPDQAGGQRTDAQKLDPRREEARRERQRRRQQRQRALEQTRPT
jgi:hypothetical protein